MSVHLYSGNDHRICKICKYELPIEFFIFIGKLLICRECAKVLKKR